MSEHRKMIRRHHSIIDQYGILNECLQLVGKSKLERLKKLRMETKLIRMKKILLDPVSPEKVPGDDCGKDVFSHLLRELRDCCGGACGEDAFERCLERMRSMLAWLSGGRGARPEDLTH